MLHQLTRELRALPERAKPPVRPRRVGAQESERKGFTLIELLLVISIIALLVSILLPSLNRAIEMARRVRCATNLRGIAQAWQMYNEADGGMPRWNFNGDDWQVPIGTNRTTLEADNGGRLNHNASVLLYLTVREGLCSAEQFVCPSSEEDGEEGAYEPDAVDFASGKELSYALASPFGERRFEGGSQIVLADASPYFDPGTGLSNGNNVIDLDADDLTDAQVRQANSRNHGGDGQNVTRWDGSTEWERRADCGYDGDNIYARAGDGNKTDSGGVIPGGGDVTAASQGPAGRYDTFLID